MKAYPDGSVKVFFLLHTNKSNKPAKSTSDAAYYDKRLQLNNMRYASTLLDADRKALNDYFGGMKTGNLVLKRGFEIHAVDVKDFPKAIKEAVDAG